MGKYKKRKRKAKKSKAKKSNHVIPETKIDQQQSTPTTNSNASTFDRTKCMQKLRKRIKFARQGIHPQLAQHKVMQEMKKMKENPSMMSAIQSIVNSYKEGKDGLSGNALQDLMNMKNLSSNQQRLARQILTSDF